MRGLNASERETIILFNEAEATAEIEAYSPAMRRRLSELSRERPGEVSRIRQGEYSESYIFPKRWIRIVPPRKATEKQREHLANARKKITA
jgi:hypothetical protein